MLQWGHALMAWKTQVASVLDEEHGGASMGPRFNGVEDNAINRAVTGTLSASMGPRFNGVEDSDRRGWVARAGTRFNGATL